MMKTNEKETVREDELQAETDINGYPFERVLWRMDRTIKRLWIALLIVFITLVGTNVGWLIYEAQFQEVVYGYEIMQDSGEGGQNTYTDNVVTMGGDYNGEADHQNND